MSGWWLTGGAEPSDALDWARNSVQLQPTTSVKFAPDDDVDAFGFEEVRATLPS